MSKRDAFAAELARLNELRLDPAGPAAAVTLQEALAARSNLLVARAAEIIDEWELPGYEVALSAAFDRFMIDALRRDPTCAAKIAIAGALNRLEIRDADLFRRGCAHIQPEPVWGGREDTAARLRAACALGLARSDPPDVMLVLAGLLADPEADARTGAVHAIAFAARPGGAPLLWYKACIGDPEPGVLHECFTALAALEPAAGVEFVGAQARSENPAVAEAALAALGRSRLPAALPVLAAAWAELPDAALRRSALRAIAGLGDDAAFAFLFDLLANGSTREAGEALDALGLMADDERRRRKIDRARTRRGDLPAAT